MINFVVFAEKEDFICDIKDYISKHLEERQFQIVFFTYEMDLLDYIYNTQYENCAVIFQNSKLEDGLRVARKVQEINSKFRFNLICDEYGSVEELFYSGVSYYIQIPFSDKSIARYVETVKTYFEHTKKRVIVLKRKSGEEAIDITEVDYVFSDRRKVIFIIKNDKKEFYYKLDEIEDLLGESFLRCHQSYLVNMDKIKKFVQDGLIIDSGEFVPVSRKKFYSSKRKYLSYSIGNKGIIM